MNMFKRFYKHPSNIENIEKMLKINENDEIFKNYNKDLDEISRDSVLNLLVRIRNGESLPPPPPKPKSNRVNHIKNRNNDDIRKYIKKNNLN